MRLSLSTPSEEDSGQRSSECKLELIGMSSPIPAERFHEAAWILLTKPHVADQRLAGAEIQSCYDETSQTPVLVTASAPIVNPGGGLVLQRILVPKNPNRYLAVREICRLQARQVSISTQAGDCDRHLGPVVKGPFELALRLDDENRVLLSASGPYPRADKLLSNFERWTRGPRVDTKQIQVAPLGLVALEAYTRTYTHLKSKYGKKLVEIWPEKTDPLKFVYEDIAIASYLIALWDPQGSGRKTSFIDLGCGNGLLVYILILEGHSGLGVDVRERGIWSLYPRQVRTCLRQEAVKPDSRYAAEWWIGNHSDELTPWIPLLASMSSPSSKVFLLPCCPYGLYGKYQRENPGLSQYQNYLIYLRDDFLPECGFKVCVDKMRIPSTKRVCLVASKRTDESYEEVVARLQNRLETESAVAKFVARPTEIPVRNCTQVDRVLAEKIVQRVATNLLNSESGDHVDGFNIGDRLSISQAAALVSDQEKSLLKAQCGGLQTLLKNNYHIFQVTSGYVRLRIPELQQHDADKTPGVRRRQCWFNLFHPQGCPLSAEKCRFIH